MEKYSRSLDNLILFSLCLLAVALPFSNSIIEIAATTAIALWLLKKATVTRAIKIKTTPLNKPILFYLVFTALSFINSQYLMTSAKGFFFKTLEYLALFFVIAETVNTKRDFTILISAILASCLLVGADGIWQYFGNNDFIRGYPAASLGRITASFKYPNGFAGWLAAMTPLCLSLAIYNVKKKYWRITGALLALLLFACLFLTFNRGAWFAIISATLFLVWKGNNTVKKIFLFLLTALIIATVFLALTGGLETIYPYVVRGGSFYHRMYLDRLCWRMFIDRPFFGHGINTFMSIYEAYAKDHTFSGISYAHNCYLQTAVETGIFGLLAFLWLIGSLFVSSLRDISDREDGFIKAAEIGLLAGLLAYLVHSAVEANLYVLQLAMLFYFLLGLTVSIQKPKE